MTDAPLPSRELDKHPYDSLPTGVWVLDLEYKTTYANAALSTLLGCAPDGMEGSSFLDFVPAPSHTAARAYLDACRASVNGRIDLPLLSREGTTVWAMVSARRTGAPHQQSLVCAIVDITERKVREEALLKTDSHYRVLAETAEDHIFVINREDKVDYVNRAAARQIRTVPEQVIGRRRSELFPADTADRQRLGLQHVFDTGKSLYVEGRTMYADRPVWLSTWLAPVAGADGTVRAVLGLSRDMTDHKNAQDALRASEERLRVVLSNVPLVLWAVDRSGTVTFCSGRSLDAYGAVPGDIVGRAFTDISVQPFPVLQEDLRRVLAGESVSSQVEAGALTFEAWAVPMRDAANSISGATGVIVDITERRRLEAELSNVQKLEAIGRLAGGIAHDFNNHLTAILGYVEMMLGRSDAAAGARDLREVQQAAQRASGLVRRLLAFGRRQVLRPRNLNLNTLIEGFGPMLERLIGEDIQIDIALAADLMSVTADASELEQVIMNLALNARDAMPAGGTLTISTANVTARQQHRPTMAAGRYALMTIRDTGTGMNPHVKDRVFEPFFTTKPEGHGTGLGLSTVYGIVKQLDGFIWVESEVGRGSTFEVYLPVASEQVASEPVAPVPSVQPSAGWLETILLVEDEQTVRRFAKLALERHGFNVIEAATPEEALSLAAQSERPLSLLLTDVVMPRINGRELADRLKQLRPGLPVLYMSGYPSSLVRQDGLIDPSMRLMSKPFTTVELIATVREILTRS